MQAAHLQAEPVGHQVGRIEGVGQFRAAQIHQVLRMGSVVTVCIRNRQITRDLDA